MVNTVSYSLKCDVHLTGCRSGTRPSPDEFRGGNSCRPLYLVHNMPCTYVSTHRRRVHISSPSSSPAVSVAMPRWHRIGACSDSQRASCFVCVARIMRRRGLSSRKTRRSFFKANCVSRSHREETDKGQGMGCIGRSSKSMCQIESPLAGPAPVRPVQPGAELG